MIRAGADLIIMTEEGFVSLADVLPVDRSQQSAAAVSRQINPTVVAQARSYAGNFGWQAFIYPNSNMLIFNVPSISGTYEQYVFNTITRAPCRFLGMNARCWGLLNNRAYFGGADAVYLSDNGTNDAGAQIVAFGVQAFNAFGSAAQKKAFKQCQVITASDVQPALGVDMVMDYRTQSPPPATTQLTSTLALWGSALWGVGLWAGEAIYDPMRGVNGVGRVAALRVQSASIVARPSWIATNVSFIPGGTL
jgi:hypothetical protein